jgi:hypothetical protein
VIWPIRRRSSFLQIEPEREPISTPVGAGLREAASPPLADESSQCSDATRESAAAPGETFAYRRPS